MRRDSGDNVCRLMLQGREHVTGWFSGAEERAGYCTFFFVLLLSSQIILSIFGNRMERGFNS